MLFENPNAKLFPAFNIPPPVRISGAVGGVEVLEGVGAAELHAHVLGATAQAQAAAVAAHAQAHAQAQAQVHAQAHAQAQAQVQHQAQLQQLNTTTAVAQQPTKRESTSGRSTPSGVSNGSAPSPSKLFVGGLSWQTSSEKLRDYFANFGTVTDVLIMKDPVTQRSRGFGFITFQEAGSVDKVLAVPLHTLDGKKIDPKHATPKSKPARTKKIFVGGVGQDTTAEEVRAYFAQFGPVEDAVMLMDQQTKRHRGFGFVTFLSEDAVDRVCDIHFHTLKNKKVECKRAQPKEAVGAGGGPLALGKRLVVARGVAGVGVGVGGVAGVGVGAAPRSGLVYPALPALPAYRYSPYALPQGALVGGGGGAGPQPGGAGAPLPPLSAAYSLQPVDMSSFQGVDWAAMYGLPCYI